MTNEIKPVECGPEPVYLSSARVQLIANGIESGSPSAAKTLARELILSNARADALHGDFIKLRDLLDRAEAENARLKASVSDDECCMRFEYQIVVPRGLIVGGILQGSNVHREIIELATRKDVDALIAARAEKEDWIHCPSKEHSLPEPLAHLLDELEPK